MSQKKSNILMVIRGLEIGGAQTNFMRLANEFNSKKRNITIINTNPRLKNSDRIESLLHPSLKIYEPPFFLHNKRRSQKNNRRYNILHRLVLKAISEAHFLSFLILRKKIGAIHSHLYLADKYLLRNLKMKNRPVRLLKICGCYLHIEKHSDEEQLRNLRGEIQEIFSDVDGVVAMTQEHLNFLVRHNIKRHNTTIFNGLNLPIERGRRQARGIRCVMCSRDEPTKGWESAIKGVISAQHFSSPISLDLIGSGDFLKTLKTKYAGYPEIRFLGKLSNPIESYADYHIGILPSTFGAECRPNSVIEYQASGLAIIGTRHGEIEQIIESTDIAAGIVIEPGTVDSMADEIADALGVYAESPEILHEHQMNAERLRARFDIRLTAQSYLEFSDSLTSPT